jgi:hypothetical protein
MRHTRRAFIETVSDSEAEIVSISKAVLIIGSHHKIGFYKFLKPEVAPDDVRAFHTKSRLAAQDQFT